MTRYMPEEAEGATRNFADLIKADGRFRPFELGHTSKVFRFVSTNGVEGVAIEKRKGAPVVYVSAGHNDALASRVGRSTLKVNGPKGRNSNLSALFADGDLLALKPANEAEFRAILDLAS